MNNNSKKYMKMKQIMIWMILAVGLSVGACHQTTVGYLLTENASYDPDTMYIRKTLDPELDAVRIENKCPRPLQRAAGSPIVSHFQYALYALNLHFSPG